MYKAGELYHSGAVHYTEYRRGPSYRLNKGIAFINNTGSKDIHEGHKHLKTYRANTNTWTGDVDQD